MPTLTGHSLTRGRLWIVASLALVLIAGHGFILYYASSHMALSAGVGVGVFLLIVVAARMWLCSSSTSIIEDRDPSAHLDILTLRDFPTDIFLPNVTFRE